MSERMAGRIGIYLAAVIAAVPAMSAVAAPAMANPTGGGQCSATAKESIRVHRDYRFGSDAVGVFDAGTTYVMAGTCTFTVDGDAYDLCGQHSTTWLSVDFVKAGVRVAGWIPSACADEQTV